MIDEPEDIPLHVAQSGASPEMDAADYDRIEVLDFTDLYGSFDPKWRLVRVTAPDGAVNCASAPIG